MSKESRVVISDGAADGRSHRNPALGLTLLAVVLVLYLYRDTVASLTTDWWELSAYSHGFLVLAISLYLIWQSRARLADLMPETRLLGVPVLLVLSLGWAAAEVLDINIGRQLAAYLMLVVVVGTLLGPRMLRVLAFPLGYLLLAIPIWSELTTTLQQNTADAVSWTLTALGVPIFHEGFYLSIPSGRFEVAEVCAGLRFLLAALSIATLYAYLNLRHNRLRVVLVALAILSAVVFNWVRVDIIVGVGYLTKMQGSLVHSHIWLGWFMFMVGLIPVFVCGAWLQRYDPVGEDGGCMERPACMLDRPVRPARLTVVWLLSVAALAVGPLLVASIDDLDEKLVSAPIGAISVAPPWHALDGVDRAWRPVFVRPTVERMTLFGDGDGRGKVSLYLGYYLRDEGSIELVSSANRVYDPRRWTRRQEELRRVVLATGDAVQVRELMLNSMAEGERIVWSWYFVAGVPSVHGLTAKFYELVALFGGRPGGAVVAISTPVDTTVDAARATLARFVVAAWPGLSTALGYPLPTP